METLVTISSFLREGEVGKRTTGGISPFIQVQKIPEPTQLYFGICTRPLSELCRITVTKLRVNETATGYYLLLRTLEPTVTSNVKSGFGRNVLVLVEDHDENRILCCLHAHVHLRTETEMQEMLPVNTVFALKEPLLVASSEQQFAVLVGSPTDFVIVGRSHVLSSDVDALGWRGKTEDEDLQLTRKWMVIGHDMFQKGKFYNASDAYLFAMKNCWDTYTMLVLNQLLSESFLAQESYESALKHARYVLEMDPLNEIALYCAGQAHYELREYTKARFYFDTLNRVFPWNKNYLTELLRCEERLREAEGNVDIYHLYRSSLTDISAPIDHGIFWGNIEFRPGLGNVRGVFATQDMEPGTLILVEKAIVSFFEHSCSLERGIDNFMRTAFRAAFKNPKTFGQQLLYLPGGYSVADENRSVFCDEINELEPIVDIRRLYQILHRNMLKSKNNMIKNAPLTCHVHEAVSRFRHSCLPNCSFLAYKDVVAVQTCASVQKGEELFLRHYGNHLSFREKQQAFERDGFTCSCLLCALDKLELTEVHDFRQELKTTFDEEMDKGAGEEKLLPIVSELELSYRNRYSLRLVLFMVYRDLAMVVDRSRKDWKDKVSFYVERGLQNVGLSTNFLLSWAELVNPQIPPFVYMPVVLFDYAGLMAEKEHSSGRLDLVRKWVMVILLLEKIYRGGNMEMLKERFLDFKEVQFLLSLFV